VLAALALTIVMMMESITSLLALLTPEISQGTAWKESAEVILGVISVVVPPESWIPILILLPVREDLRSKLIVSWSARLRVGGTVRVRVLLRALVVAIPLRE